MNLLEPYEAVLAKLQGEVGKIPGFQLGTVAVVDPLQVQPDFHTAPLAGRASNFAGALTVGDRVLILRFGRRIAVIGKAGGVNLPAPATQAEVRAGTDAEKFVSPSTLAGMLPWTTIVNITLSAAAGGTTTLTFPAGMFTTAPIVQVSKASAALAMFIPYHNNATKDGCVIGLYSGNNTPASGTQPIHVTVFPT